MTKDTVIEFKRLLLIYQDEEDDDTKIKHRNKLITLINGEFENIIKRFGGFNRDDLRQDVYLKLFELFDTWEPTYNLTPDRYFYICIKNFCVNWVTKKKYIDNFYTSLDSWFDTNEWTNEELTGFVEEYAEKWEPIEEGIATVMEDRTEFSFEVSKEEREIIDFVKEKLADNLGEYGTILSFTNEIRDKFGISMNKARYYVDYVKIVLKENLYDKAVLPPLDIAELTKENHILLILEKIIPYIKEDKVDKFFSVFSSVRVFFPYVAGKVKDD